MNGLMGGCIRGNGEKIRCMEWVCIRFLVGEFTWGNIKIISNMATESINLLMANITVDTGKMEKEMDLAHFIHQEANNLVFGRTENRFNGLINKQQV